MNLDQFKDAEDNIVLSYVVFEENTLGYLFKMGEFYKVGVLGSGVSGRNWMNGSISLVDGDDIREATTDDFTQFRVSPKGHI